ncbi:MFS transporter [Cohnella soli]|uniref:MFS transporter n=1 Tax=Cohnella soli TaxID=425005 RepID=A0ABW0HKX8_9BACL
MGQSKKGWLLFGLSLGYFMVLLDTTVVSVALPAIQADLGGGIETLQWVVNAYTIVFAGLLLSMGSLTDKMGAKQVYVGGLVIFLAASANSAVAPTSGALIGLRALLGIGGAALMPASLTLLSHAYPVPTKRARAMGIWAAITGVAMAAGPVVGGLLVDAFGWRSIFLLNVPLAVISLLIAWLFVGKTGRNAQRSLDWKGQILAIVAIGTLSFALMEGEAYGWRSPLIVAMFVLAALCTGLFLIVEAKNPAPLLPLRLFKNATVSGGIVAGMIINFGLSAILFMLPLFFQQVRGLSAGDAGAAMLPMMIPLAFNPIISGRMAGRIGAKIPMTIGFLLSAVGSLLLILLNRETNHVATAIGLLAIGFGVSFTIPSLMTAVISAVSKDQTGTVTGTLNSSRQIGATLGIAVSGSLLGASASFTAGMRVSLIAIAAVLFSGSAISIWMIGRRNKDC